MAKCSQSIHCLLFSVHVWHNHLVVCVRLCRSQWQSEANRYTASSFLLMCGTIMVVCVRVCRSQWQSAANQYTASSFLLTCGTIMVVCVRVCRSQRQSAANRYTASSFLFMCGTIMVVCVRVCRSQWQSEANRYTASSFLFMWHNYGCVCKSVSLAMARCSRSICCLLCWICWIIASMRTSCMLRDMRTACAQAACCVAWGLQLHIMRTARAQAACCVAWGLHAYKLHGVHLEDCMRTSCMVRIMRTARAQAVCCMRTVALETHKLHAVTYEECCSRNTQAERISLLRLARTVYAHRIWLYAWMQGSFPAKHTYSSGQNCTCTLYMTVHMVLANPTQAAYCGTYKQLLLETP